MSNTTANEVIARLNKFEKDLPNKVEQYLKLIGEKGVEHASEELTLMDRYGSLGFTKQTTRYEMQGEKEVIVHNNYILAPFVEFGTGVRGRNHPHPLSSEFGWGYIIHPDNFTFYDGHYGWWYPTTIDDPNTTLRQVLDEKGNPTGQYIAFTQGMESRPFMHNTFNYLRKNLRELATEIFDE